jgi:four helix bundle protein
MKKIRNHHDLRVYKLAFKTAQEIFKISSGFPKEERFSLTDQIWQCSRSVAANLAEAFRMRRYPGSFVAKLSFSEGEAAETQVWLEFTEACQFIDTSVRTDLEEKYEQIRGMIVNMIRNPDKWKV